jgi:acyl-CoA thioesterase II
MAAAKTVESHFSLHSLHTYFILPVSLVIHFFSIFEHRLKRLPTDSLLQGNNQIPILYQVERLRDGKTYATRTVKAMQRGRAIFSASFSFAVAESGISFDHQVAFPQVPDPETLPSDEMRLEGVLRHPDLEIPEKYRTYLEQRLQEQAPIDYREVHVPTPEEIAKLTPIKSDRQQVWFKCHGTLNDDPVLHQAVLAYASDANLLNTACRTSGLLRTSIGMMASLDHAVWFHAPFRADEW